MADEKIIVVGRTSIGVVADGYGMRYYLTNCCGASIKGSVNSPTGACCRACYAAVDPELGGLPEWMPLTEVYGDGLPYDVWKERHVQAGQAAAR